jgi:hypothetical protein
LIPSLAQRLQSQLPSMAIHLSLKPVWSVLGPRAAEARPAAPPVAPDTSNVMCAADVVRELGRATTREQFLEAIPHIRDGHAMRALAEMYLARRSRLSVPSSGIGPDEGINELKTWVAGPLVRRGSQPAWLRAINAVTSKLCAFVEH